MQCEGQKIDGQKPKLFSYNVVFEPGAIQEVKISNHFLFNKL